MNSNQIHRSTAANAALIAALMLLPSCGTHANATAHCSNIDSYHSNLGTVNVPLYGLGKTLMLTTAGNDKRAFGVATLTTTTADLVNGAAADKMSEKLDSSFTVTFDVKLPQMVEAEVSSKLSSATTINMIKVSRIDLKEPLKLASKDPSIKDPIKAAAADPTKRFVIVSSVKGADGLELSLASSVEAGADVNVIKYANVEVKVTYDCNGLIKMAGTESKTGIFYGVTPVKYDAATDALVFDDRPINVWEYDHSNAFGTH